MIIRYNNNPWDSLKYEESKYKNGNLVDGSITGFTRNEEYDKQGNLVKYERSRFETFDSFSNQTIVNEYNLSNQLIREMLYGSKNELLKTETFLYNTDNVLLQHVKIDEEGNEIWQYDGENNLLNYFSTSTLKDSTYHFSNQLNRYDKFNNKVHEIFLSKCCLLYTSPSPRDATLSRMPSSA